MGAQAPDDVVCRGLCAGAAIGALIGGLTPAFAQVLTEGWRAAIVGLVLGLMGAVSGAVVGVMCAVIPSVLLAQYRSYFLRHGWLARLCAISAGAVLLVVAAVYAAVHWNGNLTTEAIATVPLACGLILGVRSTDRVLSGRGCVCRVRTG